MGMQASELPNFRYRTTEVMIDSSTLKRMNAAMKRIAIPDQPRAAKYQTKSLVAQDHHLVEFNLFTHLVDYWTRYRLFTERDFSLWLERNYTPFCNE
mmetsp:Transcript_22232/g.45118  ORF Transcript_22232/g.45118 Transcript_22232/m.45118 type:complete len:97 (+) Transcript_22232:1342-1632(+)